MCLTCEMKQTKDKIMKQPSMDPINVLEEPVDEIATPTIDATSLEMAPRAAAPFQAFNSPSARSFLYLVRANQANVRTGPNTHFDITSTLSRGQIMAFQPGTGLDRSHTIWNAGWGWIRFANSDRWVAAWPGTSFRDASEGNLLPVHARSFQVRIDLAQVNFRTGPGLEFPTSQIGNFLSLPHGIRLNVDHFASRNSLPWSFTIPSRNLTQVWLGFESIVTPNGTTIEGRRGWVRADLVAGLPANLIQPRNPLMGPLLSLPRAAVVTSSILNRRTGPGTHTQTIGQPYQMGHVVNITRSQRNLTEDRVWVNTGSATWVASEHTTHVEWLVNRVFRVNVPRANIRNAPDTFGTTIIGTQPANARLQVTHRLRVTGGMDWFRFNQVIGGAQIVAWIADVNGFIEGEIGSPGIIMPPNAEHPQSWIDSRPVSLRNPDYRPGHTSGPHRPFHSTRNLNEITQIVLHHTASSTLLTRMDIEAGWRSLGWWNGGYHEMIRADGTVELCYNPEVVTNGAYGQNRFSYHISLVGNFRANGAQPPAAQMNALIRRVSLWQNRLGIATPRVVGHSERTPTICPGLNMNQLRNRWSGNVITPPAPPTVTDQQWIREFLHRLPQQMTNVLGFGSPPGFVNFMPNRTNIIQKYEFQMGPHLIARLAFQETLATLNPFGFDIKDGQVKSRSAVEHAWNTANQFLPALSIDLLDVNEFSRRLGRLVQNGLCQFNP